MKLKYIEEKVQPYFIFGKYKDGYVDLASKDSPTVISHISVEEANKIIKERNNLIELLYELSKTCKEAFEKIWYNLK